MTDGVIKEELGGSRTGEVQSRSDEPVDICLCPALVTTHGGAILVLSVVADPPRLIASLAECREGIKGSGSLKVIHKGQRLR